MRLHSSQHALFVVAIAFAACVLPSTASAAAQGCADDTTAITDQTAAWEAELLSRTNAHRTARGLVALQLDPTLTKASVWKARDMARRNYFEHEDRANGSAPARSPWDRLAACGWTTGGSRAENIAAGYDSPQRVITGWINSPGHRANIENAALRYVGFGVATSNSSSYGTYSVQMFASVPGPVAAAPTAPAPPTVKAITVTAGDAPRVLCPPTGAAFIVDSTTGPVTATAAADGCITVTPVPDVADTSATITYRARALVGGATSVPVALAITIADRDRELLEEDGATTGGGEVTRASHIAGASSRLVRSRCSGSWSVRGWCWQIIVRGRVLLDDHTASPNRTVVVSRMTASRRLAAAGRATTNASGAFTTSTRIRPPARNTSAWLARNATRIRIGAATSPGASAGVAWSTVSPLARR